METIAGGSGDEAPTTVTVSAGEAVDASSAGISVVQVVPNQPVQVLKL